MKPFSMIAILSGALLNACTPEEPMTVGILQSDRIELKAEYAEPIVALAVTEGGSVQTGDVILQLDSSRANIRLGEAQANIDRLRAVLAEQVAGLRLETIAATTANLNDARIEREFRDKELQRLAGLRERNLTSVESVDTAEKLLRSAEAREAVASAQLDELLAGTRMEQLDQTKAALRQAEAVQEELALNQARHTISAPGNALVDSLPFETGEIPRVGDVVAVLLVGDQPLAHVYIPGPLRLQVSPGSQVQVHVDGREGTLTGRVRNVAADASFTPYYALTERDRSRLSYFAEIELPQLPQRLPEGLPVQVTLP